MADFRVRKRPGGDFDVVPAALESTTADRRVRHVRGYRKDHAPHAITMIDPDNLAPTIRAIQGRMRQHQRAGGFTSYLFIDDQLRVYVMSESQSVVASWLRDHVDWLVSVYASRRPDGRTTNPDGTPFNTATAEGLAGDIETHLADLRSTP